MVDFLLLLTIAGSGDSLQGIKRGIMEMTDLLLVNKADGENRQAVQTACQEYQAALAFHRSKENGWQPRVQSCSALKKEGIKEIWMLVQEYLKQTQKNSYFEKNRKKQSLSWLREKLQERMSFIVDSIIYRIDKEALDWQAEILSGRSTVRELSQKAFRRIQ